MNQSSRRIQTRWFRDQLFDRQLSQRGLAERLGLDPAAVSLMLRGYRKMSAAEAAEIALALGVGVEEVLARAGVVDQSHITASSVIKAEPAAKNVQSAQNVQSTQPAAELLELPLPLSDGGVAWLRLPRTLKRVDAERIAAMVLAFSGS